MRRAWVQAISCEDDDRAAKLIQEALGIESDDVVNYSFPKSWPEDREQCARIIGDWLQTEARFLASRRYPMAARRFPPPGPLRILVPVLS